jgi:4-hydroxy-3-methylbut-2-enyl diphosphate reductase
MTELRVTASAQNTRGSTAREDEGANHLVLPGDTQTRRPLKIILARPRGFCAGVVRAIEIVERAIENFGPPVYVRHEIVHNRHVVESLRAKGARFVEELDEVPSGSITIFSAHGVAQSVEAHARERELRVIDATCPLVSKVHVEGRRYAAQGKTVILIGHAGHPEVEGTMGQVSGGVMLVSTVDDVASLKVPDPEKVSYITQTTLSVDDTRMMIGALKARFPSIVGPDTKDICYATQNRQQALRELAQIVDILMVIGAGNSSNSNRLREIGSELGVPSYLIEDVTGLDPLWLSGVETIGITAGASAPDYLVQALIEALQQYRDVQLSTLAGVDEDIRFSLPQQLTSPTDFVTI